MEYKDSNQPSGYRDQFDPRNPENYVAEIMCENCGFDCSDFDRQYLYDSICPDCGHSLNQSI